MIHAHTYAPLSNKIVLASHNAGKLKEIRALLVPYGFEVSDAGSENVSEPEETGATFVENAELKARHSATATGLCALSDDSGLCVDALNGDPGIYSARWAGPQKDFALAMEKLRLALIEKQIEPQGAKAHFVCALSIAWPDGVCLSVEGKVYGALTFPPRGEHGFGYDPVFIADGYDITFGEMNPDKKHAISHRADAFEKLLRACRDHQLLDLSSIRNGSEVV